MLHPLLRLPEPFTRSQQVMREELDEYEHVNNAVYLRWLDGIAWAHSASLGITLEHCLALRRGMAVRHTRIDYLEAARIDDCLLIATWIVACDGRLRCTRRFDILRTLDGKRILEAEIEYFCLNLNTGKPCRFPHEFVERYLAPPAVIEAYETLPQSLRHIGRSRSRTSAPLIPIRGVTSSMLATLTRVPSIRVPLAPPRDSWRQSLLFDRWGCDRIANLILDFALGQGHRFLPPARFLRRAE